MWSPSPTDLTKVFIVLLIRGRLAVAVEASDLRLTPAVTEFFIAFALPRVERISKLASVGSS